jgi:hypothetical protein
LGISVISRIKSLIYRDSWIKNSYVELPDLDQECTGFLKETPRTFFNRKANELHWIIQYPWITSSGHPDFIYPFSYANIPYTLKVVKIRNKNQPAGFFIYTIIRSKMKIVYHFLEENEWRRMLAIVSHIAKRERIDYLTILNLPLARFFKRENTCFAFSKPYNSNIYTSFDIMENDNQIIFDGDGDNCFT